jgi:hypothetical protein
MVTSRASFLPFVGRNVDKQSAELLFYEEQAENVGLKIRVFWDVMWCQLVTICRCLGADCCLCPFHGCLISQKTGPIQSLWVHNFSTMLICEGDVQ